MLRQMLITDAIAATPQIIAIFFAIYCLRFSFRCRYDNIFADCFIAADFRHAAPCR